MRIAFLTWRDTTHPDGGGSEVYVESVAAELARRGHRVDVVCARHGTAPRREQRDGITIHRTGGRLTVYPRALGWLLRRRRSVDVVVDVVNGLPFAAPLVRRRGVVALVHHLHEQQWHIIYPGPGGRAGWFVESRVTPRLYRQCRFVAVSAATARDLVSLGVAGASIAVARNGLVVTPGARPAVTSPTAPSAAPRLCVLARLVPHKRIDMAFEVLARLADERPDLGLDLVGEGWWREPLEDAAARLGVAGRVTFHGHVDAAERDRLLAQAWLTLVPSVKEGWCLAITEAGAQGTPSIAFDDAGGVTESIDDGVTGLLVPGPSGVDGLTAATRRLLDDGRLRDRMGEAARVKAHGLTWGATTDVVEGVLNEAASERSRG